MANPKAKRTQRANACAAWMLALIAVAPPVLAQERKPVDVQPIALTEIRLAFSFADDIYLAPVLAAEKLDFYKAAGVAIRRVNVRGGAAALEALKAGQADIIDMSAPAAAIAVRDGASLRIVATKSGRFLGWTVSVKSDSPVRNLKDLNGRKLAIAATRGLPDMAALQFVRAAGVKPEIEAIGAGALIPSLRDGKADAILSPALIGLRETAAGRARILYDLGAGQQRAAVSTYVAANTLIEKQPRALRGFLAATFNALAYMKGNRAWSIGIIKELARIDDDAFAEQIFETVIARMSADGASSPETLRAALDLAAAAWRLPDIGKLDISSIHTNDFLSTAP